MDVLKVQKEDEKIEEGIPVYIGDLGRLLEKVQASYDVK